MGRNRTRLRSGPARAALLGALVLAATALAVFGISSIAVMAAVGGSGEDGPYGGGCEAAGSGAMPGVPAKLVPIYQRAAAEYGLGPEGPAILAAINFSESTFGANLGPSSAGAVGWMQFLPSTWAAYGVDANGDGVKDPDDPEDAIFAAARYLRASGAPGNWRDAIFAYNRAGWYVTKVLGHAREYGAGAAAGAPAAECLAPAAPGSALERMLVEAERLDRLQLTYIYGGSHGQTPAPANGPFDCSSAVSRLLQVAGYDLQTMTTVGLIDWGEPGRGRAVTIHVKPYGDDAHTFLEFSPSVTPPEMRYWGTSTTNPNGGPGWIEEGQLSASYLAKFQPRRPPGL